MIMVQNSFCYLAGGKPSYFLNNIGDRFIGKNRAAVVTIVAWLYLLASVMCYLGDLFKNSHVKCCKSWRLFKQWLLHSC